VIIGPAGPAGDPDALEELAAQLTRWAAAAGNLASSSYRAARQCATAYASAAERLNASRNDATLVLEAEETAQAASLAVDSLQMQGEATAAEGLAIWAGEPAGRAGLARRQPPKVIEVYSPGAGAQSLTHRVEVRVRPDGLQAERYHRPDRPGAPVVCDEVTLGQMLTEILTGACG
jgi:hypothetical protein